MLPEGFKNVFVFAPILADVRPFRRTFFSKGWFKRRLDELIC